MPALDPSTPALTRYGKRPPTLVAVTSTTTGGLATVASGALDPYQNGDYCVAAEAVAGTPWAGAAGAAVGGLAGKLFRIVKVSATTVQLIDTATGAAPTLSIAQTTGLALQFGGADPAIKSTNIIPSGSVAAGGFGGPLD